MRTLTPRLGQRRALSEHYERAMRVDEFARLWRDAADYAGLCRRVRVPAGQTVVVPEVVDVSGADPTVILVRLLPGMLVADVNAVAPRLANGLGGARLIAMPLGTDYARLVLHRRDPLVEAYDVRDVEPDGFLGVTEDGADLALPWAARVHTLVQGSSGFGKSTLGYASLAPLADRNDVRVAGVDPSGLLWRPWAELRDSEWRVSGLAGGLADHVSLLERLCAEMDRRLGLLPSGVDNLVPTLDLPLIVVLFEEMSALMRTADADRKVGPVVRALVGRLLAEGRKTGLRVLIIVPRADATVLGAGIRDQCQLKISFAVEPEGFAMCHPASAGVDPAEHAAAGPGVAVVTAPGVGTRRIRTGRLTYAAYCERVAGVAA